jgi:ubiquinone/menaquinone biosynthesis C-methylase UbiE
LSKRDRVKKEKVVIDYNATQAFFEERGRHEYLSPLNATMYQDNNPDLVEQRDAAEKSVLAPFLKIKPGSTVLDIGCGVGRWGWFLEQHVADIAYNGIDFSAGLIEKARQESARINSTGLNFQVMSAIAIEADELVVKPPYDLLLISGLLIYLNDEDCIKVLNDAYRLCAKGGLIYVREPVGVDDRFTLDKFYSTELGHEYSAIYRTIDELQALFKQAFPESAVEPVVADYLFPENLEKRAETRQYYTVLQRKD